jgi:hypothetical protein
MMLFLKSKIAIFLYGCLFTGISFFFVNYPSWGTYLSSNGIKDPVKPFLEKYMGSIEKSDLELNPEEEEWRDCVEKNYVTDKDMMFPTIPEQEDINLYQRKMLVFNEALERKELLLKELQVAEGINSSHADRSNALFQTVQSFKDIYRSVGFAKHKCRRAFFLKKTDLFFDKFDELTYQKFELQDNSDELYKGNGVYDAYLYYLLEEYDRLIIEVVNDYISYADIDEKYRKSRNQFIKKWKALDLKYGYNE